MNAEEADAHIVHVSMDAEEEDFHATCKMQVSSQMCKRKHERRRDRCPCKYERRYVHASI